MGAESVVRDESPTVFDKPRTGTGSDAPLMTVAQQTTVKALAEVEAHRMRGLMIGMCSSSVITMLIVLALGGDPFAIRIHAIALGTSAIASGLTSIALRKPKPIYMRIALYVIFAQVVVLLSGYYFWGFFSAYGALVPLTVYIAAGNATKAEAIVGTTLCIVAQTGFGLATALGYLESRGLVEPVLERAPVATQIAATVLLQVITVGAMLAGRAARKDSEAVLDAHDKALVELAQREAQLAEAYAEARAAREAGQGGAGRFTDQTIDGFKLGNVLGRGAMGEVYAATRLADDTPVAFKLLAPHLHRDANARDRFLRELEIVSALTSPHVVRVLAVSPREALLPYIAMERLEGIDLAHMLKQQPVRPLHETAEIVDQIAQGLDAAHRAGVVHRDLKPSNVYACGSSVRTWKLLDFGASKWQDGEGTLTQGALVGTPGYMAPEQALGKSVDQRTDIYAFGVILYRMLTGAPAVVPGELPAMLQEVTFRMPVQPSKRNSTISPEVEAVLAIALAKRPQLRFDSAGELARAFRAAISDQLDPATLERARQVLAEQSWGSWMSERERR